MGTGPDPDLSLSTALKAPTDNREPWSTPGSLKEHTRLTQPTYRFLLVHSVLLCLPVLDLCL